MRFFVLVFISAVLTLSISPTAADWQDYKRASVPQAWTETAVIKDTDYTIETANYHYLVEASYTGKHREIVSSRKELFRRWAKSLRHPEEYGQLCDHEIQIRSDKQEYWLPLQNSLLNSFVGETATNSRLRLYIMYVGATGSERVFMINRFNVLK